MVQKPRSPQSPGSASPPEEYFGPTIEICQPYSERTLARDDTHNYVLEGVAESQYVGEPLFRFASGQSYQD